MGCMSALLYTERHRDDVKALVLLNPGMSGMLKVDTTLPEKEGASDEVLEGSATT